MTVILDATIGLGILLPFTIGKSTALLSVSIRCNKKSFTRAHPSSAESSAGHATS